MAVQIVRLRRDGALGRGQGQGEGGQRGFGAAQGGFDAAEFDGGPLAERQGFGAAEGGGAEGEGQPVAGAGPGMGVGVGLGLIDQRVVQAVQGAGGIQSGAEGGFWLAEGDGGEFGLGEGVEGRCRGIGDPGGEAGPEGGGEAGYAIGFVGQIRAGAVVVLVRQPLAEAEVERAQGVVADEEEAVEAGQDGTALAGGPAEHLRQQRQRHGLASGGQDGDQGQVVAFVGGFVREEVVEPAAVDAGQASGEAQGAAIWGGEGQPSRFDGLAQFGQIEEGAVRGLDDGGDAGVLAQGAEPGEGVGVEVGDVAARIEFQRVEGGEAGADGVHVAAGGGDGEPVGQRRRFVGQQRGELAVVVVDGLVQAVEEEKVGVMAAAAVDAPAQGLGEKRVEEGVGRKGGEAGFDGGEIGRDGGGPVVRGAVEAAEKGQEVFAVIGDAAGQLEGNGADNLAGVVTGDVAQLAQVQGDGVGPVPGGEPGGEGAFAAAGAAGDPDQAGVARAFLVKRGFGPVAADEAVELLGDDGGLDDGPEGAVQRGDFGGSCGGFGAGEDGDQFGDSRVQPGVVLGLPAGHVDPLGAADMVGGVDVRGGLDGHGDDGAVFVQRDGEFVEADAGVADGFFGEEGDGLLAVAEAGDDGLAPVLALFDLGGVDPGFDVGGFQAFPDPVHESGIFGRFVGVAEEDTHDGRFRAVVSWSMGGGEEETSGARARRDAMAVENWAVPSISGPCRARWPGRAGR